jgi:hypothetical protein
VTLVAALQPIVEAFERLGVSYHIGGSVASSMHGSPRSTNDVDLLVGLRHEHVPPLCATLGDAYYVDDEMLHEAISHGSSANLVHLATGWKVDVFVCGDSPFDRAALDRGESRSIVVGTRAFRVAAAEDILLRKLAWYRSGNEASDRQWSDILGILRVSGPRLDRSWLQRWAPVLGVSDLLERAEQQAAT